jgi:hypothetical protein
MGRFDGAVKVMFDASDRFVGRFGRYQDTHCSSVSSYCN